MKKTPTKANTKKDQATEVVATDVATETQPVAATDSKTPPAEEKKPTLVTFNTLGYEKLSDFDAYIDRIKQNNYNDILLTVNIALKYASARGTFTMEENEAVSVALRYLNAAFTVTPATAVEGEPARTDA